MKKVFQLLGFLFMMVCGAVNAAVITGSINSSPTGGMVATGSWGNGGAELSWSVSESNGLWTYTYDLNLAAKDNSHTIFEVSKNFTRANIFAGTTSGWELGSWLDQGNSNPGIPSELYGLKFQGSGLDDTFVIVTDRAPMWGSFYAKDGKEGGRDGVDVYAYNASFGLRSSAPVDSAQPYGFVLVPDTKTHLAPEPGTIALFGAGMLGLVGLRRKQS